MKSMNKFLYYSGTVLLAACGLLWTSLVVSLVLAFRFEMYTLPFVVVTLGMWLFGTLEYLLLSYILLVALLYLIVRIRIYFRFAI